MIRRRNVLTAAELQAIIEGWSDEDSDGEEDIDHHADAVDIIITPPDAVDDVSDNEELDENVQLLRDEHVLPREIAGQFEIEYVYEDGNVNMPGGDDDPEFGQIGYGEHPWPDAANDPEDEQEEDEDAPVASTSSGRGRKSGAKSRKATKASPNR